MEYKWTRIYTPLGNLTKMIVKLIKIILVYQIYNFDQYYNLTRLPNGV